MRLIRPIHQLVAVALLATTTCFSQPILRLAIQHNALYGSEGDVNFLREDVITPKKSVLLGIAYSLILPGLGDIYAKRSETGTYFLAADLGLWLTYGGFQAYGSWVKRDARTFATEKSGADFSGKPTQFEVDLGNFDTIDDYNQAKLRNREYDLLYDVSSSYAWKWSSEADRLHFKSQRIRGDEIIRNSQFVLGALVVNRIIAAVSAARSVSEYNKSLSASSGWQIRTEPSGPVWAADGFVLTISKTF